MAAAVAEEQIPEPRWLAAGPPYEFTRGELLELLEAMGQPMTERQLRNWADRGLLPPPSRRTIPPGATDGVVRALYPLWVLALLSRLYSRSQRDNETIEEMKAALPELRQNLESWAELEQGRDLLMKARLIFLRDGRPFAARPGSMPTMTATLVDKGITRALQRAAWAWAEDYTARAGHVKPPFSVKVVLTNAEGASDVTTIPPPPPPRRKRKKDG